MAGACHTSHADIPDARVTLGAEVEPGRDSTAFVECPQWPDLLPSFQFGGESGAVNDLLLARASALGGVFTAADALACGYDRQSLSRLVSRGEAVRIARGAYAGRDIHAAASPEQRHRLMTRAVVERFAGRVAASHYSALNLLGLPLWRAPLGQVHVARIGAGPGRRNSRLHIHSPYPADAYCLADGLGLVTDEQLRGGLMRLTRHPSVREARLAVDLADGRSESPGESRTRLVLRSLALGAVVPQVEIRDHSGRLVARVDFLYEQQRTIVEFDGLVKYSGAHGREALVAEKRREDRLRDLGFQVVRVTWAELDRPGLLQHRIQAAFTRTTGAEGSD